MEKANIWVLLKQKKKRTRLTSKQSASIIQPALYKNNFYLKTGIENMDSMQQKEHSHDYAALVARLRQGEVIECEISLGIWKGKATASRKTGMFGETLMLTTHDENDVIHITTEIAFIEFCSKNRVEFDEAIGLIEVAA